MHELSLKIPNLNYSKQKNTKANVNFDIGGSKYGYDIKRLVYSSEKNKILLEKIKLNKKLQIKDIGKIQVKTFLKDIKNNDFQIIRANKKNIVC